MRLRSTWGVAMLACLIFVHFDVGVGLPLRGGEDDPGGIELLEEDSSSSILQQLAEAERVGSGEEAYHQSGGEEAIAIHHLASKELPPEQVNGAVGKAEQVNLLTGLAGGSEKTVFDGALDKWNMEKKQVVQSTTQSNALLKADLGGQMEAHDEQQLVEALSAPAAGVLRPDLLLGKASTTATALGKASVPMSTATDSDPLAAFQKEFSTSLTDPDEMLSTTPTPQVEDMVAKTDTVPSDTASLADSNQMLSTLQTAQVKGTAAKTDMAPSGTHDWMTSALAEWGKEQDVGLVSVPGDMGDTLTKAPEKTNHKTDSGGDDLGESGDLGESDDVDSTAAAAEKNLNGEIEAEAQEAASQVVKSTMHDVERDFLFTEKAITHKLGENAPKLTLDALEKAGGKDKHKMVKAKAQKKHKEMVQKAQMSYELAIANVHKETQEQLANELSGLKIKLREAEDKHLSASKMLQQKAKEEMESIVRDKTTKMMEQMKAKLPERLAGIREKAEAEARKVASMAIKEITSGARKVRMRLQQDLGEAAGRVRAAQDKLASSDKNPTAALKSAVDLRTEKAKFSKLHDLAESALMQQKSKASKQIVEAETNAKESVALAVKEAEQKELKRARGDLAESQNKVEAEEQKKLEAKVKKIKGLAEVKIKEERTKFKNLVDAAVKMAPAKEKKLRTKAKVMLHKAKIAAAAYEEQMVSSLAPHTVDGKAVTKEMAAECVKNPTGCNLFTLKGHNTAAAAKYAESKARKAKRAQKEAKEAVKKALEKLKVATTVSQKYAEEARDMDEKETRIRLAKLQLNEAKAAAAFHSAAKAHLQTQLVHAKMSTDENDADSKLKTFESALNEMKVTHDEQTLDDATKAKQAKQAAFAKAQAAARAVLNLSPPK